MKWHAVVCKDIVLDIYIWNNEKEVECIIISRDDYGIKFWICIIRVEGWLSAKGWFFTQMIRNFYSKSGSCHFVTMLSYWRTILGDGEDDETYGDDEDKSKSLKKMNMVGQQKSLLKQHQQSLNKDDWQKLPCSGQMMDFERRIKFMWVVLRQTIEHDWKSNKKGESDELGHTFILSFLM